MPWFRMDIHWYQGEPLEQLGERFGPLALSFPPVVIALARQRGPYATSVKATTAALGSILRVTPPVVRSLADASIEMGLLRALRDDSPQLLHVKPLYGFTKNPRPGLSLAVRERVIARGLAQGTCPLCGRSLSVTDQIHIDHIHPLARGGSNEEQNLQATHAECNWRKGARL